MPTQNSLFLACTYIYYVNIYNLMCVRLYACIGVRAVCVCDKLKFCAFSSSETDWTSPYELLELKE